MNRNTQRIVAALLVFLMLASILAVVFGNSGSSQPASAPAAAIVA